MPELAAHLERVAKEFALIQGEAKWLINRSEELANNGEAHRSDISLARGRELEAVTVRLKPIVAAALAACARESEIKGLRVAAGICDAFKVSEYGPYGTGWVSSSHVEAVADEIREVIGNLEDALERAVGEKANERDNLES